MEEKEKPDYEGIFNEALKKLQETGELDGKDGALSSLFKGLMEASLEGEMDAHVQENRPNRRNGKGKKRVKTTQGHIEIETPRDRDGSFDPVTLPKRSTSIGASLERKIISLYSMGMSYKDISTHFEETYGLEMSKAQLSAVTDRVWDEIEDWRSRPLDEVYPFVWLDAMFFKVKQDGQIKKMAAYLVLGMNVEGEKDLLGIYLAETESATFWLHVLSDLESRGVKDIIIACIDNLKGFRQAIESIYPQADVQLCIVHQIRNSLRYVPWNDQREVIKDMKLIYKAQDIDKAEAQLELFEEKWGKKYKAMIKSWKNNWEGLSTFYDHDPEIRKIMYTTNSIEGFNRQVRKATKAKGALPSERALYKLLYLVCMRVEKKWSRPISWTRVINVMSIKYATRLGLE